MQLLTPNSSGGLRILLESATASWPSLVMGHKNASAVKRIMSELKELGEDKDAGYAAHPSEDNIFEWHFTLRGPKDTEFEHGVYHGKILLPTEYPFRPPDVIFLTPNGRWEVNTKICLTFTGFHEEFWQPAWGIRTALLGVQSLMASKADESAAGAVVMAAEDREVLAEQSSSWTCTVCQVQNRALLAHEHPIDEKEATKAPVSNESEAAQEDVCEIDLKPSVCVSETKSVHAAASAYATPSTSLPESPSTQELAPTHMPEPELTAPHGSIASMYETRIQYYARVVTMLETTMGALGALLILLVLKNL